MTLLPFWDRSGQVHQLKGYPESFEDWTSGEPISPDRRSLLDAVEKVTHSAVTSTRCRAVDMNLTLEVTLENGTSVIIRQRYPSTDSSEEEWRKGKFDSEVHLLSWLKKNSSVPVPSLYAVVHGTAESLHSFIVMEKLPGQMMMNVCGLFSTAIKEQLITSYATTVLKLFRLEVPQKIGTIAPGNSEDPLEVMPKIAVLSKYSADRVFDTLAEYIASLFAVKRQSSSIGITLHDKSRAIQTLEELEVHIGNLFRELTMPSLHRCVLVHDDLHSANILTDRNGHITGVVDWEFHSLQPAVLAAKYPAWLSYDGTDDPRFSKPNTWWEESPQESSRLCSLFEVVIRSQDRDYYAALVQGQLLRCAVGWLSDFADDPGCDRLRQWMHSAFKS